MQRLRELSEEECYLRCYGWVGCEGDVRILTLPVALPEVDRDRAADEGRSGAESRPRLPHKEAA